MKISKKTMMVMKNFCTINNSLWINEPGFLKTLSIAENVIGIYELEEAIPNFQLYNSVPFMSMASLLDINKVDFDFGDLAVMIKGSGVRTRIVYDDPDIISKMSKLKEGNVYKSFAAPDASFEMAADQIELIVKSANILGLPDMAIKMRDGKGVITVVDDENPDSNDQKHVIKGEGNCDLTIMVKNLVLLPGTYNVSVANGLLAKCQHTELPLLYNLAGKQS